MVKIKRHNFVVLIVLLSAFFTSCKKEIYHSFTDEERAFMVYDLGETFKLRNDSTGDTLIFKVTQKYIRYKEDFSPKLTPSRKVHYMEEGRIEFSGIGNSGSGYIYIYKDKIDQFSLSIYSFISSKGYGDSGGGDYNLVNLSINSIQYTDAFEFVGGNNSKLYLSEQDGIIKLMNLDNGEIHTRIP